MDARAAKKRAKRQKQKVGSVVQANSVQQQGVVASTEADQDSLYRNLWLHLLRPGTHAAAVVSCLPTVYHTTSNVTPCVSLLCCAVLHRPKRSRRALLVLVQLMWMAAAVMWTMKRQQKQQRYQSSKTWTEQCCCCSLVPVVSRPCTIAHVWSLGGRLGLGGVGMCHGHVASAGVFPLTQPCS